MIMFHLFNTILPSENYYVLHKCINVILCCLLLVPPNTNRDNDGYKLGFKKSCFLPSELGFVVSSTLFDAIWCFKGSLESQMIYI